MSKFSEEAYDGDTNFQVVMFTSSGLRIPFKATRRELDNIFRLHSRVKFLRPRNFGITAENGSLMFKVDLTKVEVIEAKETTAGMSMTTVSEPIEGTASGTTSTE